MASKGTSKFILQRATAVVLLPLMLWFLVSLIGHAGASHFIMRDWLASPLNAILMALLIVIGMFHMRIGMSEIIEDYIHSGLRPVLMLLNWAFAIVVALISIWSILSLAFG